MAYRSTRSSKISKRYPYPPKYANQSEGHPSIRFGQEVNIATLMKNKNDLILVPGHAAYVHKHEGLYYLFNSNDADGFAPAPEDGFHNVVGAVRPLMRRHYASVGNLQSVLPSHPDYQELGLSIGAGKCYGVATKIKKFINAKLKQNMPFEEIITLLVNYNTLDFLHKF